MINSTVILMFSFALAFSLLNLNTNSSKTKKYQVEVKLYSYKSTFLYKILVESSSKITSTTYFVVFEEFEFKVSNENAITNVIDKLSLLTSEKKNNSTRNDLTA